MTFIGPQMPERGVYPGEASGEARAPCSAQRPQLTSTSTAPITTLKWVTQQRAGAGLRNLGNTCYLNAVLQCLTHTPPLANLMRLKAHISQCVERGACAWCQLEGHVSKCLIRSDEVESPAGILRGLQALGSHFQPGRQEDAHELLRVAVEALHQTCIKSSGRSLDGPAVLNADGSYKQPPTSIENIFGGVTQSQVKCLKCGYESNTYEPVMDLSLEVMHAGDVQAALKRLTYKERLDGQNKYQCDECKAKVPADKQFTVHRAPNVLVLHLKRFENAFGGKIQRHVAFQEVLNLSGHMSTTSPDSNVCYRLYAVLVHSGTSAYSGHYYCFAKDAYGWNCFDDCSVHPVGLQSVLAESAYMLFYVRESLGPSLQTGCSRADVLPKGLVEEYHAQTSIGPALPTAAANPKVEKSSNSSGGGWGGWKDSSTEPEPESVSASKSAPPSRSILSSPSFKTVPRLQVKVLGDCNSKPEARADSPRAYNIGARRASEGVKRKQEQTHVTWDNASQATSDLLCEYGLGPIQEGCEEFYRPSSDKQRSAKSERRSHEQEPSGRSALSRGLRNLERNSKGSFESTLASLLQTVKSKLRPAWCMQMRAQLKSQRRANRPFVEVVSQENCKVVCDAVKRMEPPVDPKDLKGAFDALGEFFTDPQVPDEAVGISEGNR
eukprot:CAMPEP_0114284592 /NCGR_PEP_ID=MMETSP0059-20121206/4731_1 /TAXON_ID=36894 /ORGANISM="Pyramimonas parkeae, Strain CCMP726" /LENGTH=664 /DNA_ID=CAMNT_0001405425 /DNA_START=649 /DNA_END=2643 /DNA_ORIENTATION=-